MKMWYGFYALHIYLPFSGLFRSWRRLSRRVRGRDGGLLQQVQLPSASWRKFTARRFIPVWEHRKSNGNIRASELAAINSIAIGCDDFSNIFEIGTFDGRTALNLALSSPSNCRIFTLDLPPDMESRFQLAIGEDHMVKKARSGMRIDRYRKSHPHVTRKIEQLYGDSATFDFSDYENSCSLVFVDGSHAYDYVIADSRTAMRLVKSGGVIIWHDYGIWDGVTKALEEIEAQSQLGLKNISGTSLVYWKCK